MLRILKYLKPFLLMLVVAVALLFVQADADLTLPDYMSRIVNVGIQQGGVEHAVPEALRKSTMEHAFLFLTEKEQAEVKAHYRLVDKSSPDYETYVKKYPALAKESIYVLKDSGKETIRQLEPIMSKSMLLVFGIEQIEKDPAMAKKLMPNARFDLSKLPPGTDLFALMAQMPESQRQQIVKSMSLRFEAIGGEKAMVQAAARAVKAEYDALGMNTSRIQNRYILYTGGLMLLIALISAVATISVGYLAAKISAGFGRDLRHYLFEKVMRFSGAEFDRFSTASLITRSTNDITQVQTAAAIMVRMMFYAPIIGIGAIIHALDKSPNMWWTLVLALTVLIGVIAVAFTIAVPKFKIVQMLIDRLNLIMRENLSGMMVVRAFNRQKYEEERFDRANVDLTKTSLFVNRVFVVIMPVMMLVLNGIMVLILWVGAHEVAKSTMQVGDMIAFMQYAMQVVFAFLMLSMLFILLPRADVSANRVADVLETEITVLNPPKPRGFPDPFEPSIRFDHVYFRYPDAAEDMLHDIHFEIEPGKTIGVMGTTGSGKSTLVNLIPRFYDVTGGAIYIDGVNIREVPLQELRDKVGYVPQRSNLFAGTVESNLRYANENATEEEMIQALKIAQADFVLEDPKGLKAKVSQGGINFSGGQRQRLTIARALVKRAPIYIFDECFSALDYKTDARLRRALKEHLSGRTIIIVSQRVATIKNSDQIIVLDEGRMICKGTHHELMETCEVYREIALSQLKQEAVL
jgi:ATP-binding cassette subfamily B multidrug efflux pump